jgi:thymidylate synthase
MHCIKSPSVARSYEKIAELILKSGEEMITEDNQRCKEMRNIMVEITNPRLKSISPKYPLGKKAVEQYTNNLLYGSDNIFSYDYHSRLFEYPLNNDKINQIDFIVEKLKKQPNSRRGVAITWQPNIDIEVSKKDRGSVPCLQFVQFLIRNNKLYQTVLFRSNDLLVAYHANAIGLIALGEMVAEKIGVKYAGYVHHAISMHIYVDRDFDYIKKHFPDYINYLGV